MVAVDREVDPFDAEIAVFANAQMTQFKSGCNIAMLVAPFVGGGAGRVVAGRGADTGIRRDGGAASPPPRAAFEDEAGNGCNQTPCIDTVNKILTTVFIIRANTQS